MNDIFASTLIASEAGAQASAGKAAQPSIIESIIPFFIIFIAMYFIMIRPQAKKAKEQAKLLKSLKAGDEVVTTGGIIGRIKSVSDLFVSIDVGNATLKVLKENISRFTKPSS